MPQDPNLYGQRPTKKQKREVAASSTLDFTAQMTALMAEGGSTSASGTRVARRRPAARESLFGGKAKKERAASKRSKLNLKEVQATEEEARELERSRRKMEEKARLYSAMRKGDYVPKDNELVDFDRKWAEAHEGREDDRSSSDSDDGGEDQVDEVIEYEDEFGRTRRGTRAEKEKLDRRLRRGLLGAEELERISARPSAPQKVIYGDTIQTMAFNPEDPDKMEELARKRDRSPTPPEMQHYDADKEIRDKGVGFYKFSKDEKARVKAMESLEAERQETESRRKAQEEAKAARRKEIEARRKEIEARRARKMADSFLDVLAADMQRDSAKSAESA